MESRKQFLTRSLCFLDEDLQNSFLNIRQKCFIITKFDILYLPIDRPRSLAEFLEEQKQKFLYRNPDFSSANEMIFNAVKKISVYSTEKFIRLNISGSILDKDENYSAKILPYTHEAVIRTHLKHIGKFIRLIDYMVIHSKTLLAINLYSKMLNYISVSPFEKNPKKQKVLFILDTNFTGTLIHFSPDFETICTTLIKILKKCVKLILSSSLLADMHEFSKYIISLTEFDENSLTSDLNLEDLLNKNSEIINSEAAIKTCMNKYFESITEYFKSWQPYLKQFTNNKQLKISKFKTLGIEGLSKVIEKYKKQSGVFSQLPDMMDIDIIRTNLALIKNKLMPSPIACIEKLQKLFPDLAEERGCLLLNELLSINKKLFMVPSNIHEYIAHVEQVKQVEEKSENVALRVLDFKDFLELLETHNMTISLNLKEKSTEISKAYEKMRNRLNYIYMRSESEKKKFITILKSELKKVKNRLEDANKKLENEKFKNKASAPVTVLDMLNDMSLEVNELFSDTQSFMSYQDLLGLPRSNFSAVENLKTVFELNYSV